jgi:hypothetical protein
VTLVAVVNATNVVTVVVIVDLTVGVAGIRFADHAARTARIMHARGSGCHTHGRR